MLTASLGSLFWGAALNLKNILSLVEPISVSFLHIGPVFYLFKATQDNLHSTSIQDLKICLPPKNPISLDQESAKFSCKGSESNYVELSGHTVTDLTTQPFCSVVAPRKKMGVPMKL